MYVNPTLRESTTTLQFGQVVGVKRGYVKVSLADMDGLITDWLPFAISGDTKDNKNYKMPSIGAQVSLLLDARGERGIVLGAICSDVDSPTSPNESANHVQFKDGAVIEYDPESSTLTASGIKDARINGKGDLDADFVGSIRVKGREITLESDTEIRLQAPSAIYLNTPMTVIAGGITAGGGTGRSLSSGFRATFNIPVDFKLPVTAPEITINGISFNNHGHKDSMGSNTGKPKEL